MIAALTAAASLLLPLPQGQTAVSALAGRPFFSLRIDRGLGHGFDVGGGLDFTSSALLRPVAGARLRLVRLGDVQLSLRSAIAYLFPARSSSAFGPRLIARTWDGEIGLSVGWEPVRGLGLSAEAGALGETDFKVEHSAAFGQLLGGAEWSPEGPFSLVGRAGILAGAHGRAAIGSAGIALHF